MLDHYEARRHVSGKCRWPRSRWQRSPTARTSTTGGTVKGRISWTTIVLATLTPAVAEARSVTSTGYCLQGRMANGAGVHVGAVANNDLPLGTKITVSRSPYGQRKQFVVADRIGHGTQLDFWVPSCSTAVAWGRRQVNMRVGWRHRVGRVIRIRRTFIAFHS